MIKIPDIKNNLKNDIIHINTYMIKIQISYMKIYY